MSHTPPPLRVNRFYVYTGDLSDPVAYEARIIWGDQLRGELEASKRGVDPRKQQMLLATLWCWAEAARTGRTQLKLDDWRATVIDIIDADEADKAAAKEHNNDGGRYSLAEVKHRAERDYAAPNDVTNEGGELAELDPTSAPHTASRSD